MNLFEKNQLESYYILFIVFLILSQEFSSYYSSRKNNGNKNDCSNMMMMYAYADVIYKDPLLIKQKRLVRILSPLFPRFH